MVYINTVGAPLWDSYGIYTPGLRVVFGSFVDTKEQSYPTFDGMWFARYAAGVWPYCFLKSLMKCEVLGNAHSWPISEIDFEVESSNKRDFHFVFLLNINT